jgi:hypothetical protein
MAAVRRERMRKKPFVHVLIQDRDPIALSDFFFNRLRGNEKTQLYPTTTIITAGSMDQSPIYKLAAGDIYFGKP